MSFILGSLFDDFDCKEGCVINSTIKFEDGQFELQTKYESSSYTVIGKVIAPDFYRGIILLDKSEVGSLSFTFYGNRKGCVITGDWKEDYYSAYQVWGEYQWDQPLG